MYQPLDMARSVSTTDPSNNFSNGSHVPAKGLTYCASRSASIGCSCTSHSLPAVMGLHECV